MVPQKTVSGSVGPAPVKTSSEAGGYVPRPKGAKAGFPSSMAMLRRRMPVAPCYSLKASHRGCISEPCLPSSSRFLRSDGAMGAGPFKLAFFQTAGCVSSPSQLTKAKNLNPILGHVSTRSQPNTVWYLALCDTLPTLISPSLHLPDDATHCRISPMELARYRRSGPRPYGLPHATASVARR